MEKLTSNRSKAGRGRFVDRAGQRYGNLVAISPAEPRIVSGTGKSRFFWRCQCDCGKTTEVWSWSLSSGTTRSCGCLIVAPVCGPNSRPGPLPVLPPGGAARNHLRRQYKRNATVRDLSWELTDDEFDHMTALACFYCGLPPGALMVSGNSRYIYNGIDRKHNEVGYTAENVVPCCKTCNRAKQAMPYEEFMAWIARIAECHRLRPEVTPTSHLHGNRHVSG